MQLMKNGLAKPAVVRIAALFEKLLPHFDGDLFTKSVLVNIDKFELKKRVEHIICQLHLYLPENFVTSAALFQQIIPLWDKGDPNDPYRSFAAWPIIDYIATHGLLHPKESLATLKYLTPLFSAEFAIRPFIIKYPDYCQEQFKVWVSDQDENVRRLVSEGTRPRLPWGIRLKQYVIAPDINLPLLAALKDDESLYVRRSVANHLNDISKDHPDLVVKICKQWIDKKNNQSQWLIKHAARTLIKSGHPDVFTVLGFSENLKIELKQLILSNTTIYFGESISFSFYIASKASTKQQLVIDYALHFIKANGEQRPKVFKLKNIVLLPNETVKVQKEFSFKPISTRKYYPGKHKIEILINGISTIEQSFEVKSKV